MKKIFYLPLLFIVFMVLVFILIGGSILLYYQVSQHNLVSETSIFSEQFMFIVYVSCIPTLFITCFILIIYINKNKLPALISLIIVCSMFFVSMLVFYPLLSTSKWNKETQISEIETDVFLKYDDFSLLTHRSYQKELDHVIIYNNSDSNKEHLRYKKYGTIDDNVLYTGSKSYQMTPVSPIADTAFKAPAIVLDLSNDVLSISSIIEKARSEGTGLFLLVISVFTLFIVSCFLVARMTKWPLLNYMLIFFSLRIFFYLHSFLSSPNTKLILNELNIHSNKVFIVTIVLAVYSLLQSCFYLIFRSPKKMEAVNE